MPWTKKKNKNTHVGTRFYVNPCSKRNKKLNKNIIISAKLKSSTTTLQNKMTLLLLLYTNSNYTNPNKYFPSPHYPVPVSPFPITPCPRPHDPYLLVSDVCCHNNYSLPFCSDARILSGAIKVWFLLAVSWRQFENVEKTFSSHFEFWFNLLIE